MIKSIKSQLLLLIFAASLPAIGIIIYSNYERQQHDVNMAEDAALMMIQGLANDHQSAVEVTRRFLMTLAKLPALQNRNAAACRKLFKELRQENPQYATIFAADIEGTIFANALPSGNISIKHRKYFQETIKTKAFSAGEYTIGQVSRRAVLPFAVPIMDSRGRITGVVGISLDLEKYGRIFGSIKQFPKGSTLNLLDRNYIRLYRYPDHEKYVGKAELPEIVKQLSAGPQEGVFKTVGVDGVKRFFAYKRFSLTDGSAPYFYMRIGIPEEQALAGTKKSFLRNLGLLIVSLLAAIFIAWLLGHVLITKRLGRLLAATRQLRQGDLSTRTGLSHKEGELGQLARSFDEMAEALESKELERRQSQQALLESEIKFKSFAEQAIVGTYLLQDGVFKYVNPRFAQMFGYTVEECLHNMPFENLVFSEDLPKVKEQIRRRLSGETEFVHYTFRGIKKNGQMFDVEIYGSTSLHQGRITASGTLLDITERRMIEDSLRNLSLATEASPAAVVITDPQGNITYVNPKFIEVTGYGYAEVIGQNPRILKSGEMSADNYQKLWQTISAGKTWKGEFHNKRKDGALYWEFASISPMTDEKGHITHYICVKEDITERKEKEQALQESEERFKQLAEVFPETIFEADDAGRITYANKHALEQFGYTEEDLAAGVNLLDMVAPDDRDKVQTGIAGKVQGIEKGYLDYQALRKDGSTFYAMGLSVPILVKGKAAGVRGFVLDITQRKEAEEKIKYLATHDALTGLPSLRLARDRLTMAISQARRDKTAVAVMFADLDGFKNVNDTLGHDAGDYVLRQVAERLISCVRATDTIARVGGDEFLIIATGIHAPENAKQIAEKVIHHVSRPMTINGNQAGVSASIGIALYSVDGEDMEQLIKAADDAMYKIKNTGKNGFCFASPAVK